MKTTPGFNAGVEVAFLADAARTEWLELSDQTINAIDGYAEKLRRLHTAAGYLSVKYQQADSDLEAEADATVLAARASAKHEEYQALVLSAAHIFESDASRQVEPKLGYVAPALVSADLLRTNS